MELVSVNALRSIIIFFLKCFLVYFAFQFTSEGGFGATSSQTRDVNKVSYKEAKVVLWGKELKQ